MSTTANSNKRRVGSAFESVAIAYLKAQGLILVESNYQCRMGEIDLIMMDQCQLVFTEVRFRSNKKFGDAVETVDFRKQRKLVRSAQHYLLKHCLNDRICCRFDVLGICQSEIKGKLRYHWVKSAFLP